MKSALGSLQEKRDALEKMKKNYEHSAAHIQVRCCFWPCLEVALFTSKQNSCRLYFRCRLGLWKDGPMRNFKSYTGSFKTRRTPGWRD